MSRQFLPLILLALSLVLSNPAAGHVIPQTLPAEAEAYSAWGAFGDQVAVVEHRGDDPVEWLHLLQHDGETAWEIVQSLPLDAASGFAQARYYELFPAGSRLLVVGYSSLRPYRDLAIAWLENTPSGPRLNPFDLSGLHTSLSSPVLELVIRGIKPARQGPVLLFDEIRSWMYPEQNTLNRVAWVDTREDSPVLRLPPPLDGLPTGQEATLKAILEPEEGDPACLIASNQGIHVFRMGPLDWAREATLSPPPGYSPDIGPCFSDSQGTGFLALRINFLNDSVPAYQYSHDNGTWNGPGLLDMGSVEGVPRPISPGRIAFTYTGLDLLQHLDGTWTFHPLNVPPSAYGASGFFGNEEVLYCSYASEGRARLHTWRTPALLPLTSPWFPDLPVAAGWQQVPWFGWLAPQPSLSPAGTWAWRSGHGWIWLANRESHFLQVWDDYFGHMAYHPGTYREGAGGWAFRYSQNDYIYLLEQASPAWYHAPDLQEWLVRIRAPSQLPLETGQSLFGDGPPDVTLLPDGRLDLRQTMWIDGQRVTLIAMGRWTYQVDPLHPSKAELVLLIEQINIYVGGHVAATLTPAQLWQETQEEFPVRLVARLTWLGEERGRYRIEATLNSGREETPEEGTFGD